MFPVPLRLAVIFLIGTCLGSFVNWAIFALAWNPRAVSPWFRSANRRPVMFADRIPILGWLRLRREAAEHGRGFWIRPMLIEFGLGLALAALYWWEVERLGLVEPQIGIPIDSPLWPLHWQFLSHAILLCWMLAASFIDLDEKIIPDTVSVTGTIVGLALAAIAPMSLLPHVTERAIAPLIGTQLKNIGGVPIMDPGGNRVWMEPMTASSPQAWGPAWVQPGDWRSLAIGLSCYWLWCFALAPRIWRGRRGVKFAIGLITRRVAREFNRPPLRWLLGLGSASVICTWALGNQAWMGLLTALVGLVVSGGIVWAVRLVGTAALRREAMGFGDVTLMMMIGTFLGWQACLITFFLAPIAGLFVGIAQFVLRRDDEIPYGPFLCLAAITVVVLWAPIWLWAQPLFGAGALVPLVLVVCLVLLGVMLAIWRMIKIALFGDDRASYGEVG